MDNRSFPLVVPIITSGAVMDKSETLAKTYLESLDFDSVIYEPDGNVPPDFLLDGRIAVEVRRLNQNFTSNGRVKGLEETSMPLKDVIKKLLDAYGSPSDGASYFFSYSYSRPLAALKDIKMGVCNFLDAFSDGQREECVAYRIAPRFEAEVFKATKAQKKKFILGDIVDFNLGGFVVAELYENINHCIVEKSHKVEPYKSKYNVWWLILVDRISNGLCEEEIEALSALIVGAEFWSEIVLIPSINPDKTYRILKK